MDAGRELDFDWTVIAAVMALEGGGKAGGAPDRALEVGYGLDAFGARYDYNVALTQRGGPAFANEALRLADRYRGGISSEVPVPPEAGGLDPPVDGAVVAGFGRLYGRPHLGLDLDAHEASEVRAAASGVVSEVGSLPSYGRFVCLVHGFPKSLNGRKALNTCYGYLRDSDREIGDVVERGSSVGQSGCSGPCISPRVHFMVRIGERPDALPVDPAPFLRAPRGGT